MSIVPIRLVPNELANSVKWNNHVDAIEELQAASLISPWVTATLTSGWAVEESNNVPMQTRGTSTTAFLEGIIYTTSNKAANSVICTVPADVRPSAKFQGICDKDAAGTLTRHRFNILTNGNVTMVLPRVAGEYFLFMGVSYPLG